MFELYSYRIPFKQPFITAAGRFDFREGIIVRYHDAKIDIVSEVAPLPGFSIESLGQSKDLLISLKPEADQFFSRQFELSDLDKWIRFKSIYPSVAFGLSSLGLIILSKRKQVPVHDILGVNFQSSLKVNAVIGSSTEEEFLTTAEGCISSGLSVIKCKVTPDLGHLPDSIRNISNKHSGVTFRLDANRSWARNDLPELSGRFDNLPIEYIEEPCSAHSIEDLKDIIDESSLPVALDESLSEFGLSAVLESMNSMPYLIIKPTMHGNLMELFATIGDRFHLENRVIVTTALESALGTRAVALVAALIGSKTSAHGLNTGSLFRKNLFESDVVSDGTILHDQNFRSRFSFQNINQTLLTPLQ